MLKLIKFTLLIVALGSMNQGYAQFRIYPIQKSPEALKKSSEAARLQDAHIRTLTLPFWDDFSSYKGYPADSLWYNSSNVYISHTASDSLPSLGAAIFDGLDGSGTAYHINASSIGKTDALTSQIIDLSGLTVDDNVYISFFHQYAGYGEVPDEGDSLRLEFLTSDSVWVSVWPGAAGNDRSGKFVQSIEKVNDPSFFHNEFQFRLQSFGRQSGPFDVWNVDYVYMNKGRSENDLYYPDRTISTPLKSIFEKYTAIPYKHFSTKALSSTSLLLYNLDDYEINSNGDTIPQPFGYTLFTDIKSYKNNSFSTSTVISSSDSEIPIPSQEFSHTNIEPFLSSNDFDPLADSVLLDLLLAVDVTDNDPIEGDHDPVKFGNIDFRNNDTTRVSYALSSYYAYDDGTAEFGAGLSAADDKLAYRFDMVKDTVDHLVAIDIHFPYINEDPNGKTIDLTVWSTSSTGLPLDVLHQETISITRLPEADAFTRYKLSKSVAVTGSFFIGYTQRTNGDLSVGLDKNTSSGDKMYYNLTGTWQQNTLVEGSLMMRPVFGEKKTYTTSVDPSESYSVQVFPNPSSGVFRVKGRFTEVKVYDLRGVAKNFSLFSENDEAILNLENEADGIYILQFVNKKSLHTVKVIKK